MTCDEHHDNSYEDTGGITSVLAHIAYAEWRGPDALEDEVTNAENIQQACTSANPRVALAAMRLIEEAREWVRDCVWADVEADDIDSLGTAQIIRGIERSYDGGWAAFAADFKSA